jgi:hypothetical protein
MEIWDEARRPPSLPLSCKVISDLSSFSVLRETPMTGASAINFKKLKWHESSKGQ